jgi:hypothetical protein
MTHLGPAEIPQAFREKFELDLDGPMSGVTTKEELNKLTTRHILYRFDDKTAFGLWYIGNIFGTEAL